jgi:hypothetical protein
MILRALAAILLQPRFSGDADPPGDLGLSLDSKLAVLQAEGAARKSGLRKRDVLEKAEGGDLSKREDVVEHCPWRPLSRELRFVLGLSALIQDDRSFASDAFRFTLQKPAGKEVDWEFTTQGLPKDGVVDLKHRKIMNLILRVRCVRAGPKKIVVSEATLKKYEEDFLSSKSYRNQKLLQKARTRFHTGDECWHYKFRYERAESPDEFEKQAWLFVASANNLGYALEVYSPKGAYSKFQSQIEAALNSFRPKKP